MTLRGFSRIIRDRKKLAFPVLAVLLLAPWPVVYAYDVSDGMLRQDTARIEVAEASVATNTAVVDTITATEEVLPSHVYVLNNREIITKETWREMNSSQDTVAESTSYSRTTSPSGTIRASVKVASSHLIVVGENDTIIEIWSNTTGTKQDFYSLRVKELSVQGPEHPLTQEILARYNRLLDEVDWTETGQVYSITTAGYAN